MAGLPVGQVGEIGLPSDCPGAGKASQVVDCFGHNSLRFVMPLYTYIVTYKNSTYVAQGSHSNYRGFISTWCLNIPNGALPALTPALHKELVSKAYADFLPVSNVKNAWRTSIEVGGAECAVVVVQTQR